MAPILPRFQSTLLSDWHLPRESQSHTGLEVPRSPRAFAGTMGLQAKDLDISKGHRKVSDKGDLRKKDSSFPLTSSISRKVKKRHIG